MKTYEEGFIAGFSHNIKTVEELEKRIKKAKKYTIALREKYFKECIAGSSMELGTLLEILDGIEEEKWI